MFINKSDAPIPFFKSDVPAKAAMLICMIGLFTIGFAAVIYEFIRASSFGI